MLTVVGVAESGVKQTGRQRNMVGVVVLAHRTKDSSKRGWWVC